MNHKVYLLHYPKGVDDVQFSQGKSIGLNNKINFITNYRSEQGSSGSPIIGYENGLVIGIHRASKKKENNKYGLGIILKCAVEEFIKKKKKKLVNLTKIYILNQIL